MQRQPELQNQPGAEFNYNNTAFSLLATIVERVTGEDFPDWMRANVFEPLGMAHTTIRETPETSSPAVPGLRPRGQGGWDEVVTSAARWAPAASTRP